MKIILPKKLISDQDGFGFFAHLFEETRNLSFEELILDFTFCTWLEANLCAAFGAILSKLQENFVSIKVKNLNPAVRKILLKNHFLSNFGNETLPDIYQTTIKFRKFKVNEENNSKTT